MAPSSDIAAALDRAGAGALTEGPKGWLLDRVARFGELAKVANNPGGLPCAARGPHDPHACVMRDSVNFARFPSLDEGAKALVQVAERAGVTVGGAAAPDIEPLVEGTVNVGWIPGLGPSDEEEAKYRALRADWEAFEREGVGTTILPFLKTDLDEWRKFRSEWEANADSWVGYTTNQLAGMINAELARANRVRRELAEHKTGKDPGGSTATPGIDVEQEHPYAAAVDKWAKDSPIVNALTSPAGIKVANVLNALLNPLAGGKLNWTPVVLAAGIAGAIALRRQPTVVVIRGPQ